MDNDRIYSWHLNNIHVFFIIISMRMEGYLCVSSGCCLKTKLSERMSQCDRFECLIRELQHCSVAGWRKWRKFVWQMLGSLLLSHMGLNTFRAPRDLTNKHRLHKHTSTFLSCSADSVFIWLFLCLGYFKIDPCSTPPPSVQDCAHVLPLPPRKFWSS